MRAVTYSRCSTATKDQKPEVQVEELRKFCQARNWQAVEEIVDHGYSGGTDDRPGLKRLLALVRARKVDVVVVTKLDRMARSLKHLVSVLDEFSSLNVQFVSLHDQIDLTSAGGRLMFHIIGSFAEFERALIRERTIAGLAYARNQGKRIGRPKKHDYDAIRRLRKEGLTYSQIQARLGASRPAILRALKTAGTKTSQNSSQKGESN